MASSKHLIITHITKKRYPRKFLKLKKERKNKWTSESQWCIYLAKRNTFTLNLYGLYPLGRFSKVIKNCFEVYYQLVRSKARTVNGWLSCKIDL